MRSCVAESSFAARSACDMQHHRSCLLGRAQHVSSRILPLSQINPGRSSRLQIRAAGKKKKGGGGGGGGAPSKGKQQNGSKPNFKSPGEVKEGASYAQETRNMILTLQHVSKTAPGGKQILKNVGMGMYMGAKIGFLGANGAGKSSLMRILAGEDTQFDGNLNLVPGIRIGYLPQEPVLDDSATVLQNIETAVKPVKDMIKEFEQVSIDMGNGGDVDALMSKMDKLQTELDAIDGWEIDRQLSRAMDALRCPPGDAHVKVLSGGERRRVAIARLVLERPQIILMDEPTNHLDTESVAWLEHFLADFPGTVCAVTHDRYFLDNVAGWILELDQGNAYPFEGNYNQWLEAKAKRMQSESQKETGLRRAIEEELKWVQSNAKGQQKKGKARLRAYDELTQQATEFNRTSQLDSITIPIPPRLGSKVIEVKNVSKSFGEQQLMQDLSFSVPPGSIVGIIGGNGAGKSTLFKILMGLEKPDSGEVEVGETVKLMFLDQSRDSLKQDRPLIDAIGDGEEVIDLGVKKVPVRQYASWFNFKGGDQQKTVGNLSGGERNRLHLASVLKQQGNVLLLDEPTNDLDVDTLRALEEAILNFAGTALVISHDRYFLDRIASHILAFEGESDVRWYEGSYSEYEADWRSRNGNKDPTRVKFRKLDAATFG